ncbi:MAG: SDR family oxidoreductase [Acidimicrobiia bacterium]|nr:SDR family oxidoreductase [Acidimicrobiia bacterium]MBT8215810.1 SDR family oxidoreductase [Acidimicrobiia bacterium]NNF11413.1 SDR family oxidoreductase [Acidimicrobiia bacterium]NNL71557.1 SDR family oxidoreductase [Acidimicrobiia bacterium]
MTSLIDKALDATIAPGFSRFGYKVRQREWEPIDESLEGRTVVVTGATSGLGEAAAHDLAALGASLVLVGRNPEKTGRVREEIVSATGNEAVRTEIADLSLMAEIRELADRLLSRDEPIHVLINNAGALFNERAETSEGIERTLALNLLGHFLLTNLLMPRLIDSGPSRVINVASGGMYSQRISVGNLMNGKGEYKGAAAYARTKRGQVILTEMWAEKHAGSGVMFSSMHPGWADTPGVVESLPTFYKVTKPFLRTPAEGADTIVWLAASDEAAGRSGLFWHDREPRPTHKSDRTREHPEKRDELWSALEDLSGWTG